MIITINQYSMFQFHCKDIGILFSRVFYIKNSSMLITEPDFVNKSVNSLRNSCVVAFIY